MMVLFPALWMSLAQAGTDGRCAAWGGLEELGQIARPDLDELSGLAASPSQGALWAHNDSGGGTTLYALDTAGGDLGAFAVRGAQNVDWEDIAAAPCGDGCACLYLGDLGDQEGAREEVQVWRVDEPELDGPARTARAEAIALSYPDGAHDAETLLVDPATRELYVLPKLDGPVALYGSGPGPEPGEPIALEDLLTLDLSAYGAKDPRITGGSVSPGGLRVALRTNEDVFVFTAPAGGGVPEALATEPARFDAPEGSDGEAVSWTSDGAALLLSGEGRGATIWQIPCLDLEDPQSTEVPELCPAGCACATGGGAGSLAWLLGVGVAWRRRRPRSARRLQDERR